jgi:hypothetical protein
VLARFPRPARQVAPIQAQHQFKPAPERVRGYGCPSAVSPFVRRTSGDRSALFPLSSPRLPKGPFRAPVLRFAFGSAPPRSYGSRISRGHSSIPVLQGHGPAPWGSYPCMFSPTVRSVCSDWCVGWVCSGCCTCCCTSRCCSSAGSSFASPPHPARLVIEARVAAQTSKVAALLLKLLLISGRACLGGSDPNAAERPTRQAEAFRQNNPTTTAPTASVTTVTTTAAMPSLRAPMK